MHLIFGSKFVQTHARVFTHAFFYAKKISRKEHWEMSVYVLDGCGWLYAVIPLQFGCILTFTASCLKVELLYFQWRWRPEKHILFFPQILFLVWTDAWVMLVKKNGKQSSSLSAKAGVSSVSHRWMGLRHWFLFSLTLPFRGSGRCIPFTYSRHPAGLWQYVHTSCQKQCCSSCGFL